MDWKLLTKMYSMLEAQMLVGRLETEGIPAQAWQEGAGKAYGLTVGYLGEVRVMVMAGDLARAQIIAAEDYSNTLPDDDDPVWDEENDEL
ncbi:MAG: DUF2007 domain-containing protein [Chloroflexi bacterium]|nr:DUF2007 domain-containing protein [Chloroflexota bacterium]